MKRWILACMMAAFVVGLALPAAGQTSSTTQPTTPLPTIEWKVIPGAIYYDRVNGVSISLACQTVTHNPAWILGVPGAINAQPRPWRVDLGIRLQEPEPDGTYRAGHGVWHAGHLENDGDRVIPGSKSCDLRLGADLVTFTGIRLPKWDREYIERLRIAVRFYPQRVYPPHEGLRMINDPHHFFHGNNAFTDNLNDGPNSPTAASEEYDGF